MSSESNSNNFIIKDLGEEMKIVIPAQRAGCFAIIFMCFWLLMGLIWGLTFFSHSFNEQDYHRFLGRVVGILASIAFLYALLWSATGKEIILVSRDRLKIQKKLLGITWGREFQKSKIKKYRVTAEDEDEEWIPFRLQWKDFVGIEKILFDYGDDPDFGDEVISFGQGLDKEEAKYILNVIFNKRYK